MLDAPARVAAHGWRARDTGAELRPGRPALDSARDEALRGHVRRRARRLSAPTLNYFRAKKQFSSGVIEGLNNKAKVTLRKAYGYRTFRIAELSLYHVLGRLPEPKLAHRFF